MQSKNKPSMTTAEREYVRLVKLCPCSVCDAGGGEGAPSEAHEIDQGKWWLSVALCESCHRGSLMGWHGQKRAFAIRKMDILDALAVTIRRVHLLIAKGGSVYPALAAGAL
jgi:hypothetical protein